MRSATCARTRDAPADTRCATPRAPATKLAPALAHAASERKRALVEATTESPDPCKRLLARLRRKAVPSESATCHVAQSAGAVR
jgi:hypothetical protein